jgi:hypothetical protein
MIDYDWVQRWRFGRDWASQGTGVPMCERAWPRGVIVVACFWH